MRGIRTRIVRVEGEHAYHLTTTTTTTTQTYTIIIFKFQKQAMLVRQLEEEVVKTRAHAKETNPEIKAHIESLQIENDALTREVAILKETTKVRGRSLLRP